MLWVIFTIWFVFAIVCAILVEYSEKEIFGFFFLLSLPIMFYVPFILKLF